MFYDYLSYYAMQLDAILQITIMFPSRVHDRIQTVCNFFKLVFYMYRRKKKNENRRVGGTPAMI